MLETKSRDLELNSAMDAVGFGKFQVAMFVLLFPVEIFQGARMVTGYFFFLDLKHRCRIPGLENDTYDIRSEQQQYLYNQTIPPSDSCHIYNSTGDQNFSYDKYNRPLNASSQLISCPEGFVYQQDVLIRNAVSQLDLVCGDADLLTYASMCLFLGSLCGCTVLGIFSDRFGRRTCFLLSVCLLLPCGLGLPWAPNFALLAVLQFIVGAATNGMFTSALVIAVELVQPHQRKYPGLIMIMFSTVGEFLIAGSFYGLRDWRWVSIIITAPTFLFLSYRWLVPESLRWLMVNKKYGQVSRGLLRMTRWNDKAPPWKGGTDEERDLETMLKSYKVPGLQSIPTFERDSFMDLFKSCTLCRRTLSIFFNMSAVNILYYGFILNASHLSLGEFSSFFLSTAVEIPAFLLTWLLVDRVGRRPVHCSFLLMGALMALGAGAVALSDEYHWLVTCLALLGKMCSAGLLGTSFLWTTELFPTSVRSTGLGVSTSCARVGAVMAPYIVDFNRRITSPVGSALPFIIFGVGASIDFLLCLGLPETNDRELPETVGEARTFGRERGGDINSNTVRKYGSFDKLLDRDNEKQRENHLGDAGRRRNKEKDTD